MTDYVSEAMRKAFGSSDYASTTPPIVGALYAIAKAIDNLADAHRERTAFQTGNLSALDHTTEIGLMKQERELINDKS